MKETILPEAVVTLAISPLIETLSRRLVILVLSLVEAAITVYALSSAVALSVFKFSFVYIA